MPHVGTLGPHPGVTLLTMANIRKHCKSMPETIRPSVLIFYMLHQQSFKLYPCGQNWPPLGSPVCAHAFSQSTNIDRRNMATVKNQIDKYNP